MGRTTWIAVLLLVATNAVWTIAWLGRDGPGSPAADPDRVALERQVESLREEVRVLRTAGERRAPPALEGSPHEDVAPGEARTQGTAAGLAEDDGPQGAVTAAEVLRVVQGLIEDQVARRSPTDWPLGDALAWARRELPDLAFAAWDARKPGRAGAGPRPARETWEDRERGAWVTASYGSGSFIVTSLGPRPPERGSSPGYEGPRPPTRDQWWEQADPDSRSQWLLAYVSENSGLFEVGPRELTPCAACNGDGVETVHGASGEPLRRLCLRCAGVGQDVRVSVR